MRVHEIFFSLQGETSRVGLPTVFVRLTGCPLRCGYCDTAYAFQGGENMSQEEVLQRVANFGARYVTLTGGEPLAQKESLPLLKALCDRGYAVSLETGGSLDVCGIDDRVMVILDIKTPGSGEVQKNLMANLDHLSTMDEVKFVLCDRFDYDWAKEMLNKHEITQKCSVLFSPVHGQLNPTDLAEWILQDKLPVRMQVQLHKLLWGETAGH